jgi:hypothetical protein
VQVTFNSDTTSGNYSFHRLVAEASSISAYGQSGLDNIVLTAGATSNASIFASGILDILDYANTNKYKTTRSLSGVDANGSGFAQFMSGLWMNTAAVTSITILPNSDSFIQYSQFALYGIK